MVATAALTITGPPASGACAARVSHLVASTIAGAFAEHAPVVERCRDRRRSAPLRSSACATNAAAVHCPAPCTRLSAA
jgi:hypothetical protein